MDTMLDNHSPLGGLTDAQVLGSRNEHGPNVLTPPKKVSLWKLYLEKYSDPIIRILLVAAVVSLVFAFVENDYLETIGIILAIFFATTVGFYFERDAARKFDVLTAMNEEQPVKVRRNGKVVEVARRDVVVGDVVLLEVGDEVPADGQLCEATDLQIDESTLTGEPLTTKRVGEVHESGKAAEPSHAYPEDVVLRSTMVMNGRGVMKVTAVGDATEIGRVAKSSSETSDVITPLNAQLNRLAKLISKVGTTISLLAFVLFLGNDILHNPLWHSGNVMGMVEVVLHYFMMAVTLIVMAVPEGLPMAITLSLALNMRRMLKSNNLVRRLHACETMGAVTVICTDKTGTLTQNRMKVVEMFTHECDGPADGKQLLAQAIALNSTAELDGEKPIGNPTEAALLLWLKGQGLDYRTLRSEATVMKLVPFTTEKKYMETTVRTATGCYTFLKGAPEVVLGRCDCTEAERKEIAAKLLAYQHQAMRTLAFACREGETSEGQYHFQAVVGISDPIREDVPAAVAQCQSAGIEVKIVTGDISATAIEIAKQIGIWNEDSASDCAEWHLTGQEFASLSDEEALRRVKKLRVMSRARPGDKQRLVQLLQQGGGVVAVTGDGTNDAPALNHAHVGLSLGSGTSVAKAASDITLLDDSFRSIVNAVMWGRSLYKNIQRFLFFQLVVNVTALLLVLGGSFIGTEMPLTVTQILWVNLIMDTFAAMALASLPPSREVMSQKPRSQKDFIITRSMGWGIGLIGTVFAALLLVLLWLIETMGAIEGIDIRELTEFFTVFVMLQWWNLFNAKTLGSHHSAFRHIFSCRGMLLVLAFVLAGQWLIVTFGGQMFRTTPLPWESWLGIFLFTSPVMLVGELYRLTRRLTAKK